MFKPGKLTAVIDIGAGSSAKGLRAANIWWNHRKKHTTFAVNTFMENAAHTITDDDGNDHVLQCLSSISPFRIYDKQYVSPGCAFAAKTIIGEINKYGINPAQLGIHPNAVIVTQKDVDYEAGRVDFEGNPTQKQDCANLRIGSTLHGVGAARARRVLRRSDVVLAKDVEELRPFICDTNREILARLAKGESGLLEIAQGYQLSLMSRFFPKTTSRNVSVVAALDDALLPPTAVGPVVANFRTFPIRVNNNKYIRKSDGKILVWQEIQETPPEDVEIIKGDSGGGYSDQKEMTWEEISALAGMEIKEITSLTKLPRRVFTFSVENLKEGLLFNNTGDSIYISVNFMNYVDSSVMRCKNPQEVLTSKVKGWLSKNILSPELLSYYSTSNINVAGLFIGTWRRLNDSVYIPRNAWW